MPTSTEESVCKLPAGTSVGLNNVAPEGGGGGTVVVTVTVVLPAMPFSMAVMVEAPLRMPVTSPAPVTEATGMFDDDHVTCDVRSRVVLSEYVPVAFICCVLPAAMLGLTGVTATEISEALAAVTVTVVEPCTAFEVAEMVELPTAMADTSPAALTKANDGVEDDQATCEVRSRVELSEYVPVAFICWVAPAVMLGFNGVTAIELRVATGGAELVVNTTSTQ